jgi:hypothetical protein
LFVIEINMHLDQADNVVLQLAILGLIFVFVRSWLRANHGGLIELDENAPERREPYQVRVYEFLPDEPAPGVRVRMIHTRLLGIPDSEIKGVLDTTFEMDAEESESLFQPGAGKLHTEDVLPLERFDSHAHKG